MALTNKSGWLQALRSGEHTQGHGRMRSAGRRCCLAVYCEVLGMKPEKVGTTWRYPLKFRRTGWDCFDYDSPIGFGGLSESDCKQLINLNDRYDHSMDFPAIADWIEENLE